MKSSYKRLGSFIKPVNALNDAMEVKELLGISNQKFFQKSHTNIIGIDLTMYRITRRGQFAYNRATTRNGDKISIALRQGDDCIVSPSYRIFQVIDEDILLSEYLMMWFKRPEFDRYVRFKSHGSAHEFFEFDQMCDVELPIPHIDKQKEIVKEYNVLVNRITLNNQLIQKLEETAQAIYKQWFVDFEFPDEEGKGYKSSGGEMVFNEELNKEIPKEWYYSDFKNITTLFSGFSFKGEEYSLDSGISVVRGENVSEKRLRWDTHKKWNHSLKGLTNVFLKEYDIVIGMDGSKVGKNWAIVSKYDLPLLLAQRVACLRAKKESWQLFLYYSMIVLGFGDHVSQVQTGTSIPHISGGQILDFPLIIPDNKSLENFNYSISKIINLSMVFTSQNKSLKELTDLLLSRLTTIRN